MVCGKLFSLLQRKRRASSTRVFANIAGDKR
jgi:hypothetical protein